MSNGCMYEEHIMIGMRKEYPRNQAKSSTSSREASRQPNTLTKNLQKQKHQKQSTIPLSKNQKGSGP